MTLTTPRRTFALALAALLAALALATLGGTSADTTAGHPPTGTADLTGALMPVHNGVSGPAWHQMPISGGGGSYPEWYAEVEDIQYIGAGTSCNTHVGWKCVRITAEICNWTHLSGGWNPTAGAMRTSFRWIKDGVLTNIYSVPTTSVSLAAGSCAITPFTPWVVLGQSSSTYAATKTGTAMYANLWSHT